MDWAGGNVIRVRLIDHIVLRTDRVESMVRFYSKVLGCKVERTLPPETGLTQLRAGKSLIDIVAVDSQLGRAGGGPPTAQNNNLDHFCLQIEPVEENDLRDWLKSQGIESGEFEIRYGAEGFGPSVYIDDPDGNTVELRCERDNRE
jgi:catechol 2,3-dioxygenase-like lactoylglutathione lyase family enzyme